MTSLSSVINAECSGESMCSSSMNLKVSYKARAPGDRSSSKALGKVTESTKEIRIDEAALHKGGPIVARCVDSARGGMAGLGSLHSELQLGPVSV